MATGNLTNNVGSITFENTQINSITFDTGNKFVDNDIVITTKVTKAVLTDDSDDTDHKVFYIQIPNGDANDLILTFTTDTSGNTVVTGTNAT